VFVATLRTIDGYLETVAGSYVPTPHFQPQVAMLCGKQKFQNQYMEESGHWVSDADPSAICTKSKQEILDYCRKAYPKRDVTNIVESSHYFRIENWCRVGQKKCKGTHIVKPYRCVEGQFQSDALLVPEHCLFDHIHNDSKCLGFDDWNMTASGSCSKRNMQLRSFAMLLPCGIDVFSGVEFVCCPKDVKGANSLHEIKLVKNLNHDTKDVPLKKEEQAIDEGNSYEDEDDDEDDDDDEDNEEDEDGEDVVDGTDDVTPKVVVTTVPTTEVPSPTPDYYLTHFNPKQEHDEFKAAEKRLEVNHREKVTKVMKDWSELEERYQEMKVQDPKGAESFKKKMTVRFQKTVSALEEDGSAEKKQLVNLHQQRVLNHINEKKKLAMECYSKSLNTNPPKAQRVQKCLERLIRALEKDRVHTVNHYKHLLNTNLEQASKEKALTLDHLQDISHSLNQSLIMLDHYPEIAAKIKDEIKDFMEDLRNRNDKTPYYLQSKEAENAMLEKYKADMAAKHEEHLRQKELLKQHRLEAKAEREEIKQEQKRVEANLGVKLGRKFDSENMEDESVSVPVVQRLDHGIKVAHAQSHSIHNEQVMYAEKKEYMSPIHRSSSIYVTLAFAGVALLTAVVVGIVFLRRRSARWPHGQGFVEVDQAATPEERHVANMQVNGYENPTYKYFEARD
jgi:amyloid beta A4 protein